MYVDLYSRVSVIGRYQQLHHARENDSETVLKIILNNSKVHLFGLDPN
jgi:hypothetical protein